MCHVDNINTTTDVYCLCYFIGWLFWVAQFYCFSILQWSNNSCCYAGTNVLTYVLTNRDCLGNFLVYVLKQFQMVWCNEFGIVFGGFQYWNMFHLIGLKEIRYLLLHFSAMELSFEFFCNYECLILYSWHAKTECYSNHCNSLSRPYNDVILLVKGNGVPTFFLYILWKWFIRSHI